MRTVEAVPLKSLKVVYLDKGQDFAVKSKERKTLELFPMEQEQKSFRMGVKPINKINFSA